MIEESIFPERVTVYASFGDRFGASFIDTLVLLLPSLIVVYGTRNLITHFGSGSYVFYSFFGSREAILINYIIRWIYCATLESGKNQATIGKQLSGLRVIRTDGDCLSFAQASGRHFAKMLSIITLCIGYFMMEWNPRKQTLHDKLAGSLVVRK